MFLIYVLKDDYKLGAGPLTPLGLFFIIFGIGACWGWETGYAISAYFAVNSCALADHSFQIWHVISALGWFRT